MLPFGGCALDYNKNCDWSSSNLRTRNQSYMGVKFPWKHGFPRFAAKMVTYKIRGNLLRKMRRGRSTVVLYMIRFERDS